jgi:hypothetical protein
MEESMSAPDPLMVQPGMEVYSVDADYLGHVQNVETHGFSVESDGGTLYIPRDLVGDVSENDLRVDLSIPADEARDMTARRS